MIELKLLINTFHHFCFPVWMHQIIFSSQNPMTCRKNPHLWRLGLHVVQAGKHFLQCKAKFSHLTEICYGKYGNLAIISDGNHIVKHCSTLRGHEISVFAWQHDQLKDSDSRWELYTLPSLVSSALPRLAICWHSCRQKMQRNDARKCFPAPISRNLLPIWLHLAEKLPNILPFPPTSSVLHSVSFVLLPIVRCLFARPPWQVQVLQVQSSSRIGKTCGRSTN